MVQDLLLLSLSILVIISALTPVCINRDTIIASQIKRIETIAEAEAYFRPNRRGSRIRGQVRGQVRGQARGISIKSGSARGSVRDSIRGSIRRSPGTATVASGGETVVLGPSHCYTELPVRYCHDQYRLVSMQI